MVQYALKRLLWLIPTLWLICSLVFFLSKAVPGTCLDWQRGEFGQSMSRGLVNNSRTIQPIKPLFYFSVRSKAEPDTLYRMQPVTHRAFLKRLALLNANWPSVAAFYQTLTLLQNSLVQLPVVTTADKQVLSYQLESVFSLSNKHVIQQALLRIENQAIARHYPKAYIQKIKVGQQQFKNITAQVTVSGVLIPVVAWHGFDNEYHLWFKNFIRGNLGISCRNQLPVNQVIAESFANTFFISVLSLGLIFFLAVELSIWLSKAAQFHSRQIVLAVLYSLDSVPLFIIALTLITLLASTSYLNLFPVFGLGPAAIPDEPTYVTWLYQLPYLALPIISLTLASLPHVTGQIYQAIQQLQQRDFVLTAKAKGLSERVVLRRHVWRNALLPVITLFTGFLPALITGAVIIEIIFAIPGMGNLLHQTVQTRDFPVLTGIVLYLGLIKVVAHIIADILYFLADPRIRIQP
ncbi:ABC transporter permease [Adhaeribacter pallidiroseus]|uniref:Inner membrane ABC transporter permease protein n=1 Tax=Adhaeribacter pallidiroseus TaxID=2072847 RepID=A0A369QT85_9BACT|nr:ABC transporter permease [Adhaeribacter pallidiroseus]RDC65378.1 Inner membrane ABC transporter permease protein [Adhaeribacter pallidiroseus]